jgi:hypothetical protein
VVLKVVARYGLVDHVFAGPFDRLERRLTSAIPDLAAMTTFGRLA